VPSILRHEKYFTDYSPSFDAYHHPYWEHWRKRSPIGMDQCADCLALGNCGGGCAYAADKAHANIMALDDIFCTFSKKVITFLVQDLVKNMRDRQTASAENTAPVPASIA